MFHGELDLRDTDQFAQKDPNMNWEPSLTLRPHHLMLYIPGGKGIRSSPIGLALELVLAAVHMSEDFAYELDSKGKRGTPKYGMTNLVSKSTMQDLTELPDDAVVRLDLSKDKICNSCAIGKHCLATNAKWHGLKRNIPKTEEEIINSLRKKFLKKRLREDVDFKLVPATQEYLDYQGENLWNNTNPPIPLVIDYDAMLVRMGALRMAV